MKNKIEKILLSLIVLLLLIMVIILFNKADLLASDPCGLCEATTTKSCYSILR